MKKHLATLMLLPGLLLAGSVALAAPAADSAITNPRLINPPAFMARYKVWHYSQMVKVGNTIWMSGQVGRRGAKMVDGVAAQARVAFENIRTNLAAAGASLADVVEIMSYHRSLADRDFAAFARVKDEFFPTDYPAWTVVGVSRLADPAALLEIKVIAVIPDKGGK